MSTSKKQPERNLSLWFVVRELVIRFSWHRSFSWSYASLSNYEHLSRIHLVQFPSWSLHSSGSACPSRIQGRPPFLRFASCTLPSKVNTSYKMGLTGFCGSNRFCRSIILFSSLSDIINWFDPSDSYLYPRLFKDSGPQSKTVLLDWGIIILRGLECRTTILPLGIWWSSLPNPLTFKLDSLARFGLSTSSE